MGTLRDTIRELTSQHLDSGYAVVGQCLSAVGWVGNTLPQRQDMVELPCSDVAGPGFVVGMALAGKRPMLIIRYQGFSTFNSAFVLSYAAKAKAMWNTPCPMLVRGIAMEGSIGPVAGSSHHSLWMQPGMKVISPMTKKEWAQAYRDFMESDDVVYLSEHRGAWANEGEACEIYHREARAVIFPISVTRFAAYQAAVAGLPVSVCPLVQLYPLVVGADALDALQRTKRGVVMDDAHPMLARAIAHDLSESTGARVTVMGLGERTAGFYRDVLPPTAQDIFRHFEHG